MNVSMYEIMYLKRRSSCIISPSEILIPYFLVDMKTPCKFRTIIYVVYVTPYLDAIYFYPRGVVGAFYILSPKYI